MSACDTCAAPGACCRDMAISSDADFGAFYVSQWPHEAVATLAAKLPGHPFIPLRLEMVDPSEARHYADAEGPYGIGHWSCTRLTPEGRCGDYDNRPALCRSYEPLSDRLCVMYVPPDPSTEEPNA